MTKEAIKKCLTSYGFYPFTLILLELEEDDRFEECAQILSEMNDYREKFSIVEDDIPTMWSEKFEEEYYSYFKAVNRERMKSNVEGYIKDIKNRIKL